MGSTAKAKTRQKASKSQTAGGALAAKAKDGARTVQAADSEQLSSLRRWNGWLAAIFGLQSAAILVLGMSQYAPVTTHYLATDPLSGNGQLVAASRELFTINFVQLAAAVLLVAAVAHGLIATVYRRWYEAELARGLHRLRLLEWGVTSGLMLIGLGLLGGVYDVTNLMMILGFSLLSPLLHLAGELQAKAKSADSAILWRVAYATAVVPWLVLAWYAFGTHLFGMSSSAPFVYELYGLMAILFAAIAMNHYFEIIKRGRWLDPFYGEKVSLGLSVTTKTAFAWMLFGGLLHP